MVSIETATVRLGDKEYTISEQPRVRAKPWRVRLLEEVKPLFAQLENAGNLSFDQPGDLVKVLPLLEAVMLDGLDSIAALTVTFAPELEADREYIEQNATEKQIMACFMEAVKLSDPFGLANQIGRLSGLRVNGTSSR